jgi:hypothetical protein
MGLSIAATLQRLLYGKNAKTHWTKDKNGLPRGLDFEQLECVSCNWNASLAIGMRLLQLECVSCNWNASLAIGMRLM